MSALGVGVRVRVIANHSRDPSGNLIIGHEGVILRREVFQGRAYWLVHVPTVSHQEPGDEFAPDEWGCLDSELVPIIDPKAAQFIAGLERLAREPNIEVQPETVTGVTP